MRTGGRKGAEPLSGGARRPATAPYTPRACLCRIKGIPQAMITGYNTDVRHVEMVIHVQTEDKGRDNPFLESVIYVGGRAVTTKRSSYAELLA